VALGAAAALLLSIGAPGVAGGRARAPSGKKPIRGTFVVRALPFPRLDGSGTSRRKGSCQYGVFLGESGVDLRIPSRGVLFAEMRGFSGDWDLYVLDTSGGLITGSIQNQLTESAPPEEQVVASLRKGDQIQLIGCNWLGGLEATVEYRFVPQRKR